MVDDHQLSLALPPPPASGETPLIPARMVNEWVYCPRLAYLEWVENEWADSGDTAAGKRVHARVDEGRGICLPDETNLFRKGLIEAKVRNTRTMLRRNWRAEPEEREEALVRLQRMAKRAMRTKDAQELLGIEGEAAAVYFGRFESMLATEIRDRFPAFAFEKRNRRPPTDPVNAMLSFAYALLTRIFTTTISATGLDPYMGFYHRPRHGRPALAQSIQGHEGLWPLVPTICFPVPFDGSPSCGDGCSSGVLDKAVGGPYSYHRHRICGADFPASREFGQGLRDADPSGSDCLTRGEKGAL